MDSWWLVGASVLVSTLLVIAVFAATILLDSSWPISLSILASLGYLVGFAVHDIRRGVTHPVTHVQQRNHRIVIGVVVVVALIVLWLAR